MANISDNKILVGATLILSLLVYSYYIGQLLSGVLISAFLAIVFFVPLKEIGGFNLSKTTTVLEEFGGEVLCDSRIYEKANFFIGVPIGIVLGKIFGKYESVFTIRCGKGSVVVVYPGICPVSGGSNVRVSGTWHEGENVGVKGNFVRAERIVDESTGLVFALKK